MKKLNDLLKVVETKGEKFRLFGSLFFGDSGHSLSIQATYGRYCFPRKTLPVEQYESFEVMADILFEDVPKDWDEYGDVNDVFGWVPREKIEQLIAVLEEKYGEVH